MNKINQVWIQVLNQVWYKARNKIQKQVYNQTVLQVRYQISDQIYNLMFLIRNEINYGNQTWKTNLIRERVRNKIRI